MYKKTPFTVVKELQDSREYTFATNFPEIYTDETKQFYEGEFTAQISRACNEYNRQGSHGPAEN